MRDTFMRTKAVMAGWVLSGLLGLFFLFDGAARIAKLDPYVEGLADLGFVENHGPWIGVVLIAATLVFLVPWTSVLGAVLLTGYLGGAVAAQVRIEEANFLFALGMGIAVWAALLLRDPGLWRVIPVRRLE